MNTDAASRRAIDNAERYGYLPALRAQAQSVCAPLWWHGYDETGTYRILHNGTLSFVDTGSRKIGITADHVIAQYLDDVARDPTIVCQFGSAPVDIRSRVIVRDRDLDLATIEVSDVLVGPTGASFHAPTMWPPAPVAEGEVVLCGGYPGRVRVEHEVSADLPFQWFIGRATSASAHNVSLHLNFEGMHMPLGDAGTLNRVIGGMSGGPLFRFVSAPIEHLLQVGVIYQYHESYELILARPASLIGADGTITPQHAI